MLHLILATTVFTSAHATPTTTVDELEQWVLVPQSLPVQMWSSQNPDDTCDGAIEMVDGPVVTYRDRTGDVHVGLPNGTGGGQLTGPDFLNLTPDCSPLLTSSLDETYANYNHREWLYSGYTTDGQTVHGLVHVEYHMNEIDPSICDVSINACRNTALTYARSDDGGATWTQLSPEENWIAVDPYGYTPVLDNPFLSLSEGAYKGFEEPSRIVHNPHDGYNYAIARMGILRQYTIDGTAFDWPWVGPVLMRTDDLSDPASWRAWSGPEDIGTVCEDEGYTLDLTATDAFDIAFQDPCASSDDPLCTNPTGYDPEDHTPSMLSPTCGVSVTNIPPVASKLGIMHESLMRSTLLDAFVLVGMHIDPDTGVEGIYYSLSPDLLAWTDPKLLATHEDLMNFTGADQKVSYPSLFDPTVDSFAMDTIGRYPFLAFVAASVSPPDMNHPYTDVYVVPLTLERTP